MKKYWWHDSKSNTAIFSFALSVALIAASFLAVYIFGGSETETPITIPGMPVVSGPIGLPDRLIIPSIGVNALVQTVGIDSAGRMGIPTNFVDVAWYKLGPRPGESGSAVIDGHLDTAKDANAVFINLSLLKSGDDIYILDKAGQRVHFRVTGKEVYNYDKAPVEKIFDQGGKISRLNLVTCDGTWNQVARNYSERLVVYSERVLD